MIWWGRFPGGVAPFDFCSKANRRAMLEREWRGFMATRKFDAGKKSDYSKLTKMSGAAFLLVEGKAEYIALSLMKGTSNGATLSKRLLLELAVAGVDVESLGLGPTITVAARLALEAQVPACPDEDEGDGEADD
jgi:hypothetical protein